MRRMLLLCAALLLSACGGGSGGSSAAPATNPPPPAPPPPVDPTTTTEWGALVTRLEIRITEDRTNLLNENFPGCCGGNFYRAARDGFVGYADAFWGYAHDETIDWTNASSVTFNQADVAVLLDDFRMQWEALIDAFIASLPQLDKNTMDSIIREIRPPMLSAVNDGYENTLRLLEAFLVQSLGQQSLSAIHGSWTTDVNDMTIFIHQNSDVVGYEVGGCIYVGLIIPSRSIEATFRIILRKECGSNKTMLSSTALLINYAGQPPLLMIVPSDTGSDADVFVR